MASELLQQESVEGWINYAGPMTRRGLVPTDPTLGEFDLELEARAVTISNARTVEETLDLDQHGFQLVQHQSEVAGSRDREELDRVYQPEMCALLQEVTGAREVLPERRGLVLRFPDPAVSKGARTAGWAHMDYSAKSAEEFRDLFFSPEIAGIAPYRRWAILQAWRVTSPPPQDTLLAVTDGRTVKDGDWHVFDTIRGPVDVPGSFFESRLGRADPGHRWYYFPEMSMDEVIVFKGHDSDPARQRHVLHTAFVVPYGDRTPIPRSSIEGRYFAFFD